MAEKLLTELERFLRWLARLNRDEKREHSADITEAADVFADQIMEINEDVGDDTE